MNFRNKVSCFIYSALSVFWKVILHLPKILNHPLLSFTSSTLNRRDKLWVTTSGCSDVTILTRIMALVRILIPLKWLLEVCCYLELYSLSHHSPQSFTYCWLQSVTCRGAVSNMAATVGRRPDCCPLFVKEELFLLLSKVASLPIYKHLLLSCFLVDGVILQS